MSLKVNADQDHQSVARLLNLPAPVADSEPATKLYVDTLIEGLAWKDNVRVGSTGNINLSSPGATIDGITMSTGDRVLVKDQTTGSENGIYLWNGASAAMTRTQDGNTNTELLNAMVSVDAGTNTGTTWRQTAIAITLGATAIAWASFGATAPSASTTTPGLVAQATQAEVDAGSVTNKYITPATLASWAGRVRKTSQTIGDGASTQFDITHNFGTRDVLVSIYRNSTPWDDVLVDQERPDANTVRVRFLVAPASNAYRVVVTG